MFEVIPGILEKEWGEIERKINIAKQFTKAIHIDIIDGKFAPNTTFLDPAPFAKYTFPQSGQALFFELHMMVENPIQYLKPFADAGFKRFLGHIEKMPDQENFVGQAQLFGEVGLAIDGPTDLSEVKIPYEDLNSILVMTIKGGQSGQEFNPEYLKKVGILLRQLADQDDPSVASGLAIEVDGGINDKTILLAKDAGANRFASTSFIFGAQNCQEQYNLLKEKVG